MTVADDVLRALRARPAGMTDAEIAAILHKNHPQVNQVCRRLADQGLLVRDGSAGGIINKARDGASPVQVPAARTEASVAPAGWGWEGNIQARVATYLATSGWSIIRVADTAQRERGADIIAEKDGQRLIVEAKGWPGTTYSRGERAGQPKPTAPTLQATHWFAEGLTTLIRRGPEAGSRLALALPDMARYRTLLAEAGWALDRLEITVFLVTAEGTVKSWEREN
jgi:MarR family